ncbi:MAG TPA: proline dehydrogenase family protein [bacterium]|nr:proline dehydrogenase family protein [bacterium]
MVDLQGVLRRAIIAASHNPDLARLARRHGMRLGASRFVAGETLDGCVTALRALAARGFVTNTTLLGESVTDAATAERIVATYLTILDRIAAEGLPTNPSVKLTHLGLDVGGVPGSGEELAYRNIAHVAAYARARGNFVRIDMEDSPRVDPTLRIYRRLRAEGIENVGIVVQSYLYRTERDVRELLPLRPNIRVVKGAYLEPPSVAFPRKADVDRNYLTLAELLLTGEGYTAIATHDDRIVSRVIALTEERAIPRSRFEFQMLYGVRPRLQADLFARGFRVLIATPYGPDWYPYLMRRLAERPANLFFVLRNLLRG